MRGYGIALKLKTVVTVGIGLALAEFVVASPMPVDAGAASQFDRGSAPVYGTGLLGDVPTYRWWHGCSPTAGGMIVGAWDSRPGYGNLYEGDASVWYGDGTYGTRRMVASQAHIGAGGYQGHAPDCLADFMKTVDGGSYTNNIVSGLEAFIEWDDPSTPNTDESYEAEVTLHKSSFFGGDLTFDLFKTELDAGRPILLDALTGYLGSWYGHSIVAYGYVEDAFTLYMPGTYETLSVPGFYVHDTWADGTSGSDWYGNASGAIVDPIIDAQGREIWPYLDLAATNGYSFSYRWDWMISEAIFCNVVPEPATMFLLGLPAFARLLRRRRQH